MSLAENGWNDRVENYADGWARSLTVTTAENIMGIDVKRPVVLYSVNITVSQNVASGDVSLVDTSATGDAGTLRARFTIASGVTTDRNTGSIEAVFPRGMVFQDGLVVSGTTVTGSVTLSYRARL